MVQSFHNMEQLNLSPRLIKLLSLFFTNPKQSLYVRQIASALKWAPSTTSRLLKKLENLELLESSIKGNLKLFNINLAHPLTKDLKSIINKQHNYPSLINHSLKKLPRINSVSIYGSAKNNKLTATSDIDLLIVGSPPIDKLNHLLGQLEKKISRPINYSLYSLKEFKTEAKKPGFLASVLSTKPTKII